MTISRRGFIKGLAALAAVAIAPSITEEALVKKEHKRLLALMNTGLIENEIFYLEDTLIIQNIDNLIIRNCTFKFPKGFRDACLDISNTTGIQIIDCIFTAT